MWTLPCPIPRPVTGLVAPCLLPACLVSGCLISQADLAARLDRDGDGVPGTTDCDDDDPAVGGGPRAWLDRDGDAWGGGNPFTLCADPAGTAPVGGDCDDRDPDVHPGLLETPDGRDNDCDGLVDETTDLLWLTGTEPGDAAGSTLTGGLDLTGDGLSDLLVGAPLADPNDVEGAGRTWIVSLPGLPWIEGVTSLSSVTTQVHGTITDDRAGSGLAALQAADASGVARWAVSTPLRAQIGEDSGVVHLFETAASGTLTVDDASSMLLGAAEEMAGATLAPGDDVLGDGGPSLLVLAPATNSVGCCGYFALVTGDPEGSTSLDDAPLRLEAEDTGELTGASPAVVDDLDGDGLADLALGVPRKGSDNSERGAVFVWTRVEPGVFEYNDTESSWRGEEDGARAGACVRDAGDVTGDGLPDLAVGLPGYDAGRGAAVILSTPWDEDPTPVAWILGDEEGAALGTALDGAGDLNTDGYGDLVIGAPGAGTGLLAVFMGPVTGTLDPSEAQAALTSEAEGDLLGFTVLGAGDLDGDGSPDLAAGAPGRGGDTQDAGAVLVVFGSLF